MKDTLRQRLALRLSPWFPVLLLATLAMLTYWLDAQVQRSGRADGRVDQEPDYYLEDFAATRFGPDGTVVQRLSARRMMHYAEARPTELVAPNLVDTPPGRPPMQVQAELGKISHDTNHIYLTGHVVATRAADAQRSKLTLSTEYLHVLPREEKAMTDKTVKIVDATGSHVAAAMEMDNKARTMRLHGGVTGEIKSTPQ